MATQFPYFSRSMSMNDKKEQRILLPENKRFPTAARVRASQRIACWLFLGITGARILYVAAK
jgi:hypothetical protein